MIFVLPLNQKLDPILERHGIEEADIEIDVTSRSKTSFRSLSPFLLGPCKLKDGRVAKNMENAWQYSKVYAEHLGRYQNVRKAWLEWSSEGFANNRAVRYPMYKGAKPEFSLHGHKRLDYVEARKHIYFPLYAKAAHKTREFGELCIMQGVKANIVIRDFDAYDHRALNMSLMDVAQNPNRNCGHGFVLAMMLEWGPDFYKLFK